jgi:glycosyltransferase involved in cell wall biosynthesis
VSGKRVLLVSHEATRTGAPAVAIEIARTLGGRGYEVVTVLRLNGPLRSEFGEVSARVVVEPASRVRVALRYFRLTRRLATRLEQLAARVVLRRERPALVYLNSVKSACYVRPALEQGRMVILHVHEGEPLASSSLARYELGGLMDRLSLVACSVPVRANLASIAGVDPARINLVTSAIDVDAVMARAAPKRSAITPGAGDPLVVGACGVANRGKGVDLWLEMAALVRRAQPGIPVRFTWVGRASVGALREVARGLGIDEVVTFEGEVPNPYPLLAGMDIVTVPSRADAFPLVALEAMALARPVVAFALPGLVSQLGNTGVVVPPDDPPAMAQAVLALLDDPDRRLDLGRRAAERVRGKFGIERFRENVERVVADALSQGAAPGSEKAR